MLKNKIGRRSFLKKLGLGTIGGILATQLPTQEKTPPLVQTDEGLKVFDGYAVYGTGTFMSDLSIADWPKMVITNNGDIGITRVNTIYFDV